MITSTDCFKKFGPPENEKNMVLYHVNGSIPAIPKRIYCNAELLIPLEKSLIAVIDRGLKETITSWDGCFNIRKKRGATSSSLHSWGLAIDINAAYNQFGKQPKMDLRLVKCFTDNGFDWGGYWRKPDGMHFQLSAFKS